MGKKAKIVTYSNTNFYEQQKKIDYYSDKYIYKTHFESRLIKETIEFYKEEANQYI